MPIANLSLQKALYLTLKANLTCSVYDLVPDDAEMPYVTLDNQMAVPSDGLTNLRDDVFFYLTVWSKYLGQKEVLEIIADVRDTLHRAELPLDVGRMVKCYVESATTQRDIGEKTFMGKIKLKIILQH